MFGLLLHMNQAYGWTYSQDKYTFSQRVKRSSMPNFGFAWKTSLYNIYDIA